MAMREKLLRERERETSGSKHSPDYSLNDVACETRDVEITLTFRSPLANIVGAGKQLPLTPGRHVPTAINVILIRSAAW